MGTEDQGDKVAAWILAARYTEMVSGGEGGFTDGRASQDGVILLRRAYRHLTGKQMPYPLEYFTDDRSGVLSKTTSREVMERDGWKCRSCGWTDGLHVHHIVYRSHMGSDKLDNLITLCWQCHRAIHDGFLKLEVTEKLKNNQIVKFVRLKNWKPA